MKELFGAIAYAVSQPDGVSITYGETMSTLLLMSPHCQVLVIPVSSLIACFHFETQEESELPCGRCFSQRSLPAASVKGAYVWYEQVHL